MRRALVIFAILELAWPAFAHDDAEWIQRSRPNCCGPNDCKAVFAQSVTLPALGYQVPAWGFIHESETLPSEDGQFWLCVRGGQRTCFFAPPRSM